MILKVTAHLQLLTLIVAAAFQITYHLTVRIAKLAAWCALCYQRPLLRICSLRILQSVLKDLI